MKTFKKVAAQGEISIRRITKLPASVEAVSLESGKHIIGHSETGHHHVLDRPAKVFRATNAPAGMRILYAIVDEPNSLVHERDFDTHESVALLPGIYEFRCGRELDPYAEAARRQAD